MKKKKYIYKRTLLLHILKLHIKITYINDIFYYEFCSSAQRSNIKSRLTSSLFGHLQIILGQISIKIFHRRFESEWLPRHTRPRRYFHCIILKNYFISHKKFNGDWNSNCIQMHFAIPFRHMIIIFRICDSVSFSPSPPPSSFRSNDPCPSVK